MTEGNHTIYEFGPFRLDARKRLLWRNGDIVALKPKAFDTLLALVEANGRILEKDELMKRVWPDTIVEEGNLSFNISALRKALGDNPHRHEFIVTIPGAGYQFVAGVRTAGFDELEVRERHRISIEEVEGGVGIAQVVNNPAAANASAVLALPAPAKRSRTMRVLIAGGLLSILLALAGIGVWRYRARQRIVTNPFQQTTIRRLTSLGSALQAALSPDGKLFVYSTVEKDGRHSLWLGHTDGGEPVQLRPPADVVYGYLTFAPDGSSLYFIVTENYRSGGDLYRLPVFGGVPEKLKEQVPTDITLAPDGKRFAFTRRDQARRSSSLVVAAIEGPAEVEVASRPVEQPFASISPAWSSEGSRIAAAAVGGDSRKQEIFILSVADGATKQLTARAWAAISAMTWLKDGSGMIVAGKEKDTSLSQLWHVSSADGTTRPLVADLSSYTLNLSVPASNDAVLTVQYQYSSNIWVSPADDPGMARQISFGSLGKIDGVRGFDWTPDGRIVYRANVDQSQTIWSMDAAGGNQKQLLPTGYTNNNLSVTDDGKYVVFESNRSGDSEVWRASIDSGDMRQLTTAGNNYEPHASPAGEWIVYRSTRDDLGTLWRVSVNGGEPRRVTDEAAAWPRVSPDGKWVACAYHDSQIKLAIVPIEGGSPVRLFDLPRLANLSYGLRWTPDGQAVTYHDWASGIWKQTLAGGEPQRLPGLPAEKMFGHGWSRDGKLLALVRGVQIRDVVLIRDQR